MRLQKYREGELIILISLMMTWGWIHMRTRNIFSLSEVQFKVTQTPQESWIKQLSSTSKGVVGCVQILEIASFLKTRNENTIISWTWDQVKKSMQLCIRLHEGWRLLIAPRSSLSLSTLIKRFRSFAFHPYRKGYSDYIAQMNFDQSMIAK